MSQAKRLVELNRQQMSTNIHNEVFGSARDDFHRQVAIGC